MRILVVSDTHGDFYSLKKAIDEQKQAEVVIHCGDSRDELDEIKMMWYNLAKDLYLNEVELKQVRFKKPSLCASPYICQAFVSLRLAGTFPAFFGKQSSWIG